MISSKRSKDRNLGDLVEKNSYNAITFSIFPKKTDQKNALVPT